MGAPEGTGKIAPWRGVSEEEIDYLSLRSLRFDFFFFEQGTVPKDQDAALIPGGGTNYTKDLKKHGNYNLVLEIHTEGPRFFL